MNKMAARLRGSSERCKEQKKPEMTVSRYDILNVFIYRLSGT